VKVITHSGPDYCHIQPQGEIDARTSDLLEDSLQRALVTGCCNIYLDLEKVQYISSAGLGVIISVLKRIEETESKLIFINVPDSITYVLDMVSLTDYLTFGNQNIFERPLVSRLSVPGHLDQIKIVREFAKDYLSRINADDQDQMQTQLVLEELCSNLVRHSFLPGANQNIVVELRLEGKTLEIKVYDKGMPFDPSQHDALSLEELIHQQRKGGLGLRIVKQLSSNIDYYQEGDVNVCKLQRELALA
jgi:anti-anti-sigma factor